MKTLLIAASALVLVACQPSTNSTSDTAAAPAADAPDAAPASPSPEPPPAYVGAWAADPAWCANTVGPERPIVVTATEFQGYENSCDITGVQATEPGWTATFVCQAEGVTTNRPVAMAANRERLEITWIDEGYSVDWRRCPA